MIRHNKVEKSARAPEQTFEEAKYLKHLIESGTPVRVKMEDGEEVTASSSTTIILHPHHA